MSFFRHFIEFASYVFLEFFQVTLFRVRFFSSVAYLKVANLAQLGIAIHC